MVGAALALAVGGASALPSMQYRPPTTRSEQLATPGLELINCPTVMPAACARAAQVSPWCASIYLVHAAETPENNNAEEASRALMAVDDTMIKGEWFQVE